MTLKLQILIGTAKFVNYNPEFTEKYNSQILIQQKHELGTTFYYNSLLVLNNDRKYLEL